MLFGYKRRPGNRWRAAGLALGETPSTASLMLWYFFAGFVVAAQVGGRASSDGERHGHGQDRRHPARAHVMVLRSILPAVLAPGRAE